MFFHTKYCLNARKMLSGQCIHLLPVMYFHAFHENELEKSDKLTLIALLSVAFCMPYFFTCKHYKLVHAIFFKCRLKGLNRIMSVISMKRLVIKIKQISAYIYIYIYIMEKYSLKRRIVDFKRKAQR